MIKPIYRLALLSLFAGFAANAAAAENKCPLANKIINDSNNLIMLSGTAKGNIRLVVAGMVGKDLDEQARSSISFDPCSRLVEEGYDYHKTEGRMTLRMSNHTVKAGEGWETAYDIAIIVDKDGAQRVVNHKQGKSRFFVGKKGVITSSTDAFTINDRPGFTTTTYDYDNKSRLITSTARGTDGFSNDEYTYAYDKNGYFSSMTSMHGKTSYKYDPNGREAGSFSISRTLVSQITKVEECQRNDDVGNCILSYGRETEIFPQSIIRRHRSTATQYQYWDTADKS
ncbi:hypothetical protein [Acerihabitans arboris]|uniref:YD repeat-containing protein n=1 Tax=Acerihabitans arboris TaxID=2691583 RepID=A0A845SQU0_9GAMM|nr:hypothetical protein [Acerihabitans arboris]NDL64941.1 hypothetical protein [Acerihabitans arboris]